MISPGIIVALVVCGGLMLFLITRWARLRRKSVWERFARRYRLAYLDTPQDLAVEGTIDGRPFALRVTKDSSDTGLLGIESVLMTLDLHGSLPEGLEVSQGGRFLAEVHQALDASDIQTGDEEFDQQALVKGSDAAKAIDYLTPDRKDAVRTLLSVADCWNSGLRDGAVFFEDRNLAEMPVQLHRRLRLLRDVAPYLDGNSTR